MLSPLVVGWFLVFMVHVSDFARVRVLSEILPACKGNEFLSVKASSKDWPKLGPCVMKALKGTSDLGPCHAFPKGGVDSPQLVLIR